MDHTLEISWWPTTSVEVIKLPATSQSFFKNTTDADTISVQIEHICALFHVKWRPILTVIDICQLHALNESMKKGKSSSTYSCLVIWYDRLRLFCIQEAQKEPKKMHDWIPDVMHRFLVRLESQIGHSPKALQRCADRLESCYSKSRPWIYGKLTHSFSVIYSNKSSFSHRYTFLD